MLRLKGVNKGRVQLYYYSGSSVGTSVLPALLVKELLTFMRKFLLNIGEEKVRDGDQGKVTINCGLKCYLPSKAELLKSGIASIMNEWHL